MSNIKDIAKLANVSPSTVSRVVNNHPYVSSVKKEAVLKAIEALNYTPNISAIRLKSGKTNIIAILIPYIDHGYFGPLIKAINETLSQHGYMTILCETENDSEKELYYLEMLRQKQVDGMMMCTLLNKWQDVESFLQYGPIVLCGEYSEERVLPTVYVDHYEGAAIAIRHLIEQGYNKIAYASSREKNLVYESRKQAYLDCLQKANLPLKDEWLIHINQDHVLVGKDIFTLLSKLPEQPDAIFVANGDQAAAGLVIEAQKHGWHVPDQLAIIGIDNQPISELLEMSTVEQPIDQIGTKAAKLIVDILEENQSVQPNEQVYFKLVSRQTT